jgi:hypothetical protein
MSQPIENKITTTFPTVLLEMAYNQQITLKNLSEAQGKINALIEAAMQIIGSGNINNTQQQPIEQANNQQQQGQPVNSQSQPTTDSTVRNQDKTPK